MRQAIATSRATFDRLTQGSSVTTDWCDSIADTAVVLREHGLLADLIIMSLPRESEVAQADPVDLATATVTPILHLGAATSAAAFPRVLVGLQAGGVFGRGRNPTPSPPRHPRSE